ncbi:MAG: hypothetical protein WBA23_24095, partial [Tunicatimonas sp.]
MNQELLKVSLRQQALFISIEDQKVEAGESLSETTSVLVANAARLGFTVEEELLWILNRLSPSTKLVVLEVLREVAGVNKNWTPLVKRWDVPTGESVVNHIITFITNSLGSKQGTHLACGHVIPVGTFPLDRYNGCPFCGTPFEFGEIEAFGQGSKLKVLAYWKEADVRKFFFDLLQSKTALDATQVDSLKVLLKHYSIPEKVQVGMKETLMLVIDTLVEQGRSTECSKLLTSPQDILRYLWYKHTGFLQIIEPKTIIARMGRNHQHVFQPA